MVYRHVDFQMPEGGRNSLYAGILRASEIDPEYLALLGLSSLIALLGLLQNSAAVIIGAMLISPLMNPILSAGLAFLLGDGKLGLKSALVLTLSIAGAIAATWLVSSIIPLKQATAEIMARTNPNLLDLFIAFLSGLAGTLAMRTGSASLTILPGVAIAVAVVPPLAVVGYGLSTRQFSVAGGAFLLFITNLVSIIISAALVFHLIGFRPREQSERDHLKLKYRMAISLVVLLILAIPLFQTLRRAVVQVGQRSVILRVLNNSFKTENSAPSEVAFSQSGDTLFVRATLRTTQYFDAREIGKAEKFLQDHFGPRTKLDVDQILMAQGNLSADQAARLKNFISGGVVRPVQEELPFDLKSAEGKILAHFHETVTEVFVGTPIHFMGSLRAELGKNVPLDLKLRLASDQPLEPQTIALLTSQLSSRLDSPTRLQGTVELQGPSYILKIETNDAHKGLTKEDRQALTQMVAIALARADLRLQGTYSYGPATTGPPKEPPLVRDIRRVLMNSRLKEPEWSFEPASGELGPKQSSVKTDLETKSSGGDETKGNSKRPPAITCTFVLVQHF
jgi:uncharacterized hydrophobic protein (TIGR00271 family)